MCGIPLDALFNQLEMDQQIEGQVDRGQLLTREFLAGQARQARAWWREEERRTPFPPADDPNIIDGEYTVIEPVPQIEGPKTD